MAINGFPANIGNVIEQVGFLERKFHAAMRPKFVFRNAVASRTLSWFEGQIGETKTFTRSAEIPPQIAPLNPASNTGLDNGIVVAQRSFEQWQAQLFQWAEGLNINILGNETLLADLYLDDIEKLGGMAANSIELVCGQRVLQVYDTGDTFCTANEATATAIPVDNIFGFDTQYLTSVSPSYGLPAAVSSTNKIPVLFINSSGAVYASANVIGVTADVVNKSYMVSGPLTNGQSGTLTLDAAVSVTKGDRVVAMDPNNPSTTAFNPIYKDGSYVVRPLQAGVMVGDAYEMAASNVIAPSVQIPQAVALLKRRNVPKLANGLYGCAIDSTLMSYFYQDDGFLKATATNWDRSPVFRDGVIAAGWGVEFTDATQLPVYTAPAGGFALRHAFVFGEDVISEHPFTGARTAASRAGKTGDMFDIRWVDRIEFITQAALDRLGETIKLSYKYVGDFRPGTDKGSNPQTVLTSDYCRFKRGVLVQAASAI